MSLLKSCAIIGLGNPGESYRWTRHNAGKIFLDNLAKDFNIALDQRKDAILWGEGKIEDLKIFLAFPETYMNLSGRVVPWLKQKNVGLPDRVLILSDDINLSLGTLRYREGGSAGGQKGLLSIIQAAGSDLGGTRCSNTVSGLSRILIPEITGRSLTWKESFRFIIEASTLIWSGMIAGRHSTINSLIL